jgi:SAM-dependent methyltransferase
MLLYALTILVSAFLLFQVQPVIAKIILPWFGGSAAVWTTCLLFFQMVLLLGYLYAHAVVRYLKPKTQMVLHCALLLLSAAALPIYPSASWKPSGAEEPTFAILKLLLLSVGLPYFLLSTTGPLIQAWYARRFRDAMPYRLYALSNAGSMFALISYPPLFEPFFGTHRQAILWSVGYGVFILVCAITALKSGGEDQVAEAKEEATAEHRPGLRQFALWIALPACASILLLATTNHLSQNVAAIPFLWVLPLSIYLLTFILTFEGSGWYRRNPYLQLLAVALAGMAMANKVDSSGVVPIKILVPLFSMGLYTCCMVCHGELARLKPHPRYLTHFYLMISAGGAVGGLFVGLIAPHFFPALYEFPIGIALCGVLVLVVIQGDREYKWFGSILSPAWILGASVLLVVASQVAFAWRGPLLDWTGKIARIFSSTADTSSLENEMVLGTMAIVAVLVVLMARSGRARGKVLAMVAELIVLTVVGYISYNIRQLTADYRLTARNFYGALRVRDSGLPSEFDATRTLTHGTINHGEQFLNPMRRDLPTTYYGPGTGVGIAIKEQGKSRAIRVGVIGLGTGTLASYGREGDYFRFYEINPLVLKFARTEFTFLNDCKAKLEVAMGDARLSLEKEAPEKFDVLAVDAFSSDSIPVHLLTREAMEIYRRHLAPGGILAVHISNRYLDLQPVLLGETQALGLIARMIDNDEDDSADVFSATWVLITEPATGFTPEEIQRSSEITVAKPIRLWTDDYSNLFQILK